MNEVLYECIPPENYNIKSKPDLDCHIRAILSLHKFITVSYTHLTLPTKA